jgi:hypothetical protein
MKSPPMTEEMMTPKALLEKSQARPSVLARLLNPSVRAA